MGNDQPGPAVRVVLIEDSVFDWYRSGEWTWDTHGGVGLSAENGVGLSAENKACKRGCHVTAIKLSWKCDRRRDNDGFRISLADP